MTRWHYIKHIGTAITVLGMMKKECKKCGEHHDLDAFSHTRGKNEDGTNKRREVCKFCIYGDKMVSSEHTQRRMHLNAIRHRCKNRGIPFDLSIEDLHIPDTCPALGIVLKKSWGGSKSSWGEDDSPSMDRLVPELGYTKGNVRVISNLANRIKTNATIEQIAGILAYMRRAMI